MSSQRVLLSNEPNKLEVYDRAIPQIGDDEVLLQVRYCGVCGSDLARFAGTDVKPNAPTVVWGHEATGVVVQVGAAVTNVNVGDCCAIVPLVPCRVCYYCAKNQFALCDDYSFIGSRVDGAFAEYVKLPASNLVEIPPELDLRDAIWIEPLSVALHAFFVAGYRRFETNAYPELKTAVVFGPGPIGLLAIRLLSFLGVPNIVAVGTRADKLKEAEDAGATYAVNYSHGIDDIVSRFGGADLVFEMSGAEDAIASCFDVAGKLASVVCVGKPTRDLVLKPQQFEKLLRRELKVSGSWMSESGSWPGEEWSAAVKLLAQRSIDVSSFIVLEISFEQAQETFDKMLSKELSVSKVVVVPSSDQR